MIVEAEVAGLHFIAGRSVEGEAALRDSIAGAPRDLFPRFELAMHLEARGDLARAPEVLEQAKHDGASDEHAEGEPDRKIAELRRRLAGGAVARAYRRKRPRPQGGRRGS